MFEFYLPVKAAHIALALCSGALFAVRGGSTLAGMHWPHYKPVRRLSYVIDACLLVAGLFLVWLLPAAMFANGWLVAKLVLLFVYIALGVFAMRRGRSRKTRAVCFVAALAVFGLIYSIARAHHPLGVLHGMFG